MKETSGSHYVRNTRHFRSLSDARHARLGAVTLQSPQSLRRKKTAWFNGNKNERRC